MPIKALRGATTVDSDSAEQVTARVQALMGALMERNALGPDDLISVILTATGDIESMHPATAARSMGLDQVALLGARELDVVGSLPRCIRVLAHVETDATRLRHVYLEGARDLRRDLLE